MIAFYLHRYRKHFRQDSHGVGNVDHMGISEMQTHLLPVIIEGERTRETVRLDMKAVINGL